MGEAQYDSIDRLMFEHRKFVQGSYTVPPDSFWRVLDEELLPSWVGYDFPDDHLELAECIAELGEQSEAQDIRVNETGDTQPPDSFWAAYEKMTVAYEQRDIDKSPAPLESMKLLSDQGVSHRQIAKIYGLRDHNGEPQVHLVAKELQKKGSGIPKGWEDPRVKAHRDHRRQRRAEAQARLSRLPFQPAEQDTQTESPEPIEQLLLEGVPVSQIARMKNVSQDEILAQAKELGVEPVLASSPFAETAAQGQGKG